MAYIVHMSVFVHTTAPCSICFSVFVFVVPPCPYGRTSRTCGCLLAAQGGITLTTRAIRSQIYILSNSYKLVRAPRLLCRCRLPHGVTWCSDFKLCVLPTSTHSAISPQVQTGPTRTVTSDLMSAMLAEAATHLSFAAFLERCIFVNAAPSPQLPVPTPPLDAATQTLPHTATSRDVSTQLSFSEFLASPSTHDVLCPTCSRPVPSLLLDAAVQTPLYSVATHDASTQLPLTEFFIGCILSNDPLDRQALPSAHCNAGNVSLPHSPDIATLCSPSSASHASDGHEHTTAPHVLLQPPPGLEKYAHQFASHGILVRAAPVRPRLCTSISVTPPAAKC